MPFSATPLIGDGSTSLLVHRSLLQGTLQGDLRENIPVEFLSKRQHGAEILRRNSFEAATVPDIVSDTQLGAQQ